MPWTRPLLAIVVPAALAACSGQLDEGRPAPEVPAANVTGEATSCVPTGQIRNTRVHGDQVIDFHMTGGRIYRNTLPNRCPSLGFEERFAYRTTTSQLCSLDTITVLQTGGVRGATCGLGEFVPIELADAEE